MTLLHLAERLRQLDQQHRRRELVPRIIDGCRLRLTDGRELLNFGSNDYLGFAATRPEVTPVDASTATSGSTASPLVCGWTDQHQRLADLLCELESTAAACLFPSGFAACLGTVATLAQAGDLILSDQLNHASLIDGCRLSRADCIVYPHRDVAFVERTLGQVRSHYAHVWIVTDGVFSMDGHVAPVQELVSIAEQHQATVMVDEAHGTGVLGQSGSGLCEAVQAKSQVPIRIGTLSKAIGSQGGFVVGPQMVIDYLVNHCRALIYSTALAPPAVSGAIAGVQRIHQEPERRKHVQALAIELRERLGIPSRCEVEASVPIVPVLVGSDQQAIEAASQLAAAGYFVPAIRPPTVPPGTARLRISLSALHDHAMVRDLAETIRASLAPWTASSSSPSPQERPP